MSGTTRSVIPGRHDAAAHPGVGALVRSRTPAVAAVTSVLVTVSAFAARANMGLLVSLVLLAPVLATVAVIDASLHRVPDVLTAAGLVIAVLAVGGQVLATQSASAALRAIVAAVAVGLLYLMLWWFAGLGLGDVKLAATLALVTGGVGWQSVLWFVVFAHLLVAPLAIWRLAHRRHEHLAFAPALVVGLYASVAVAVLMR